MPVDYQQLARDYARHRRITPFVLENLILTAGLSQPSRVLDVGSGTGNYSAALAESTVRAGTTWCTRSTATGAGLSMLNRPPEATMATKHRPVTTTAIHSVTLSGSNRLCW